MGSTKALINDGYNKMYHRVRRKMRLVVCAILLLVPSSPAHDNTALPTQSTEPVDDNYENNIIDFDEEYSVKFNKRYGAIPWNSNNQKYSKESHRYTIVNEQKKNNNQNETEIHNMNENLQIISETTEADFSVIPLELVSTTENYLVSILESTTDPDLSVIPLSTTVRNVPNVQINLTVTLPSSTQDTETTYTTESIPTTSDSNINITTVIVQTTTSSNFSTTTNEPKLLNETSDESSISTESPSTTTSVITTGTDFDFETSATSVDTESTTEKVNVTTEITKSNVTLEAGNVTIAKTNLTLTVNVTNANATIANQTDALKVNSTKEPRFNIDSIEVDEKDVPIFTELDSEDEEVPEDYYDGKDVIPTTAPKTNAISVLVGLAGSVVESMVESVAERVVPKGIFDLFKRMQKQNEQLEAERLRSREENGGLGQLGRGILKSISSGLSKPFTQLMAGARDIGSLDSDRGFVSSLASGVTSVANVANSLSDAFKDRVQAIYPGTVWCGDGHSATARSGELGLFFFTDTCCRQHDACKIYIKAGDTKYGLTNTGLFTRSHCSCDMQFRECLRRTNSLVSAQIGLTYFNVLGPQCFRKAHPIVKCVRRTRITGQKCEEYQLDYTKPKMWQWFDNETF
ncbi:uncharacterized protein LOC114350435 isoform X1 [Ostrinia furnacalis]|uniref:uncharacterized protein LOC114350435 isoform X1 n=2 Tax=Ostrinia furnacalis TaxID=93504 RepID=UPI00103A506A|nr:uncharacterized protein LOC114350435 isoform X1 [Ostrinia furnacalis]